MKICEYCNEKHDGSYGSGRFCNSFCARGFSTNKNKEEWKNKIKNSIDRFYDEKIGEPREVILNCKNCNIEFKKGRSKRNQIFCSNSCQSSYFTKGRKHSKESREKISASVSKNYLEGKQVYGERTKWYDYKNIRVQGTYELRACKILDSWKKSGKIRSWEYTKNRVKYKGSDGKDHSYLLDFKIFWEDSFYYLETKGYITDNDRLKWKKTRENFKLVVWMEEDIKREEDEILIPRSKIKQKIYV